MTTKTLEEQITNLELAYGEALYRMASTIGLTQAQSDFLDYTNRKAMQTKLGTRTFATVQKEIVDDIKTRSEGRMESPKMIPIFANERPDLCAPCGGKCCKKLPGAAFPENFPTPESLETALSSGRWTIDWWEGDPRPAEQEFSQSYYIRPAVKGHEGKRYHGSWGGECTFLTDNGCELSTGQRPLECLSLKPEENSKNCAPTSAHGKREAAIAWLSRLSPEIKDE